MSDDGPKLEPPNNSGAPTFRKVRVQAKLF
jgi:hypothetical protein